MNEAASESYIVWIWNLQQILSFPAPLQTSIKHLSDISCSNKVSLLLKQGSRNKLLLLRAKPLLFIFPLNASQCDNCSTRGSYPHLSLNAHKVMYSNVQKCAFSQGILCVLLFLSFAPEDSADCWRSTGTISRWINSWSSTKPETMSCVYLRPALALHKVAIY